MPIKFIAVFLNASDANMKAFAPFSYGFGNWGVRTARARPSAPNYAAKAHALGKKWMAPVAFQDARPRSGTVRRGQQHRDPPRDLEQGHLRRRRLRPDGHLERLQRVHPVRAVGRPRRRAARHQQVLPRLVQVGQAASHHRRPPVRDPPDRCSTTPRPQRDHEHDIRTWAGRPPGPRHRRGTGLPDGPAEVSITTSAGTRRFDQPAGISAVTVPLAVGTISAELSRAVR